MVTYMPGAEALLAPAGREIAQGVNALINPNFEFQKTMQLAIAQKPELLKTFGDLAVENPQVFEMLGFSPQQQKAISATGATPTATKERELGAQEREVRGQELGVRGQKAEVDQASLEEAIGLLQSDDELMRDRGLQILTGQTGAQRRTSEAQATTTEAQASVSGLLAQVQRAQAGLSLTSLDNASVNLPDLGDVNLRDEARNFLDGKLPADRATAFFNNPQTSQAFQTSLEAVQQERAFAQQIKVANLRQISNSGSEYQENYKFRTAAQMYESSGGIANVDMWRRVLFDEQTQNRLEALRINPEGATTEEKEMLRATEYLDNEKKLSKVKDVRLLALSIQKQEDAIREARSDSERRAEMETLNLMLQQRAAIGGPAYTASWDDKWYRGGRVEYKDVTGNTVSEDEARSAIADPMIDSTPDTLEPRLRSAYEMIKTDTDPESAMAEMERADNSQGKQRSAAVRRVLESQGLVKRRTTSSTTTTSPTAPTNIPDTTRSSRPFEG